MIFVVVLKRKVLHVSLFMTYFFVKASVKIEIYKVVSELRNFCRLQEVVFILPYCSMPWPSTYKLRFE